MKGNQLLHSLEIILFFSEALVVYVIIIDTDLHDKAIRCSIIIINDLTRLDKTEF